MTLEEFIQKYDGKYVDIDGMYGNQCKDLFSAYNSEVVGNPNYVWGNANELWDKAPSEYYSKESSPQRGDVVIWSTAPYGHVGIYLEGGSYFTSFDQNFPIGSPCHKQGHGLSNIIGYLHPKGVDTMPWSDEELRNGFDAVIRDFDGYQATPEQLDAHMAAAKERQKEGPYGVSEFVHDRKAEMPAKDCSAEIAIVHAEDQEIMDKKMKGMISEKDAQVAQDDAVERATEGLIKPSNCPKPDVTSPKPNVTWLDKIKSWFNKKG